ncbi:MAG: hypothetical protein PHD07_02210 [Bacteroidales bacterium]|nr:hypothetical protein [Bacteroidales bacterium]
MPKYRHAYYKKWDTLSHTRISPEALAYLTSAQRSQRTHHARAYNRHLGNASDISQTQEPPQKCMEG